MCSTYRYIEYSLQVTVTLLLHMPVVRTPFRTPGEKKKKSLHRATGAHCMCVYMYMHHVFTCSYRSVLCVPTRNQTTIRYLLHYVSYIKHINTYVQGCKQPWTEKRLGYRVFSWTVSGETPNTRPGPIQRMISVKENGQKIKFRILFSKPTCPITPLVPPQPLS